MNKIREHIPTDASYYDWVYASSVEYAKEDPKLSIYYESFQTVLNMIPSGAHIVELGCGTGLLAKLLIEHGFHYVEGIDFSLVAIKKARQINIHYQSRFNVADVYKYDVQNHATVICLEVLEHLADDISIIKKLPKCDFIFSVPDFMCDSHQRCFHTEKQIICRYGKYINIESITKVPITTKNSVWVIKANKQ